MSCGDKVDQVLVVYNELTPPVTNEVLTWNGTNWTSAVVGPGGVSVALDDLTDVSIGGVTDGDILVYNSGSGIWEDQQNIFTQLEDTPASYVGQFGKVPTVNIAENGLEFLTTISDHGDLTGLGDDDHEQYTLANGTRVNVGSFASRIESLNADVFISAKAVVTANVKALLASGEEAFIEANTTKTYLHLDQQGVQFDIDLTSTNPDRLTIRNNTSNARLFIETNEVITTATENFDHTALTNIGTNTHAQIDTHLADATIHFTEGSIDHTAILNIGTNTHGQIDTHIADSTIHFTEGSIDHGSISGLADDDHTQYLRPDAIRSVTGINSGGVTSTDNQAGFYMQGITAALSQVKTTNKSIVLVANESTNAYIQMQNFAGSSNFIGVDSVVDDRLNITNLPGGSATLFIEGNQVITTATENFDHTALTNIGTNTHAQIDSHITVANAHIADSTIHFTEGSISHTAIQDIGTNTHPQIDTHIADSTIHFTEASIDHGSIAGLADDDHTQYHNDARGDARYYTKAQVDALPKSILQRIQANIGPWVTSVVYVPNVGLPVITDGAGANSEIITLTDGGNTIMVEVGVVLECDGVNKFVSLLGFRGNTCIGSWSITINKNEQEPVHLVWYDDSPGIGPHTYSLRYAASGNNMRLNAVQSQGGTAFSGPGFALTEIHYG